MTIYTELGIAPIINAAGTLTTFGGSLMPPQVTDAMAEASRAFVDMQELHLKAGQRIAVLIGVEAAHICNGAAAGIAIMAAACMAGTDRAKIARLPDTTGMRHTFIVHRSHRNPFDQALRLAGGRFHDIDADMAQLQAALQPPLLDEVAAVYYTFAWFCTGPALSFREVTRMAHAAGVPVIVDAAAEVPPIVNLTQFLDDGADLVVFSGGKAIRGPQSSGMILGRADLVEACRLNDAPHMAIGRPMKVGKEEIAGLVKAVELYVNRDHNAEIAVWKARVAHILAALSDLPHVRAWQQWPYGIGQQIPHAAVSWDEAALGISHEEAHRRLLAGPPRIAAQIVSPQRYDWSGFAAPELRLHPHTLQEGEEITVARCLRELLAGELQVNG